MGMTLTCWRLSDSGGIFIFDVIDQLASSSTSEQWTDQSKAGVQEGRAARS